MSNQYRKIQYNIKIVEDQNLKIILFLFFDTYVQRLDNEWLEQNTLILRFCYPNKRKWKFDKRISLVFCENFIKFLWPHKATLNWSSIEKKNWDSFVPSSCTSKQIISQFNIIYFLFLTTKRKQKLWFSIRRSQFPFRLLWNAFFDRKKNLTNY